MNPSEELCSREKREFLQRKLGAPMIGDSHDANRVQLLQRVRNFLPVIAAANKSLEAEIGVRGQESIARIEQLLERQEENDDEEEDQDEGKEVVNGEDECSKEEETNGHQVDDEKPTITVSDSVKIQFEVVLLDESEGNELKPSEKEGKLIEEQN